MRRLLPSLLTLWLAGGGTAIAGLPPDAPATVRTAYVAQQRALQDARNRAGLAKRRSEALERQAESVVADAERAAVERAALGARVDEAAADLDAAQARIVLVTRRQQALTQELDQRRLPLMRLAAALQIMARRPAELALTQPGSIADIAHVRILLETVLPDVRRRTAELRAAIDRSRTLRRQNEVAALALRTARTTLDNRRQQLAQAETSLRSAALRIDGAAASERERAIGLGERARDIIDQMDKDREADEVRSSLVALDGPSLLVSRAPVQRSRANRRPAYLLPVLAPVLEGTGELADNGVRARGTSFRVAPATPLIAPAAGKVVFAGRYRSYGRIVIIDHGAGWTSLLTGAAGLFVTEGAAVAQGDRIGVTGQSGGPVMVELRRRGRPVDIAALMR